MAFLDPFKREQMIKEESMDISLNFMMLRFFLHLTAILVKEMAMQLARKSSSAFFKALRRGIWSSDYTPAAFLAEGSSKTMVSVPYEPSGKMMVLVITLGP